ncbi:unnamed protein product [Litomosoides sigmodontis]|uniref:Uncharacterized protein n=1 Tax=Litomosoides sigmodontis TaxID=42156 RepID=A0A3P6SQ58_LITSI|nr:unnamed protein product [Litomosoides sigmodontis]
MRQDIFEILMRSWCAVATYNSSNEGSIWKTVLQTFKTCHYKVWPSKAISRQLFLLEILSDSKPHAKARSSVLND